MSSRLFSIVWFIAFVGDLAAHEFWLQPARFRGMPGNEIPVSIRVGSGSEVEERAWKPSHVERCFATRGKTVVEVKSKADALPAFTFSPPEEGNWTIAYDSTESEIELDGPKFEAYLKEEGLDSILDERKKAGESTKAAKEHYSRCAKSILRIGTAPAKEPLPALGLPFEIVAESLPEPSTGKQPVGMQVLFGKKPIVGLLVKATRLDDLAHERSARTDDKGHVSFDLEPGNWRITSVYMERAQKNTNVDWRSYWASLTFEMPTSAKQQEAAPTKSKDG